jgi:flagellar hook assembly protein FlgD
MLPDDMIGCAILFIISEPSHVRITSNDRPDHVVRVLMDDQRDRGEHRLTWDLYNNIGKPVSNGIYRIYIVATFSDTSCSSYGDVQVQW